jgi:short-subunit dehydrogenase
VNASKFAATPRRYDQMSGQEKKIALITGATSGIGAAFAKKFASEGYDLIVTGRRKEKLNALADELFNRYRVNVEVILIELSNLDDVEAFVDKVKQRDIDILINNAGFATRTTFYEEDLIGQESLVSVHVLIPMKLIHAVLPNMIRKGHGIIINVSSMAAFWALPRTATYSGTKAFLRAFSESLHVELISTGVKVQALCPGLTRTDFHERIGIEKSRQVNKGLIRWMSPEEVVDASLKGLRKNQVVCVPGSLAKLRVLLPTLLPSAQYYKLIHKFFRTRRGGSALEL